MVDRFYPDRYTPGELDFDVRIAFESKDGERASGPGMKVVAGTCGTWIIEVINNHGDLGPGARVGFTGFNCQFAYRFQAGAPRARDHVTVETESDAELAVIGGGPTRNFCEVLVRSGVLRRGESFTVRLGDRRGGGVGSEVFWTATHGRILTAVDADGSGAFVGAKGNPFDFEVVADDEPKLIRLLGPTVAAVGEPFALHLGVFDRNRNVIETFTGCVSLSAPEGLEGVPQVVELAPEDRGLKVLENVTAQKPGVYRMEVRSEHGDSTWLSNPIVVEGDPSHRVFWGDVHAHGWGDSTMYLMHRRTPKLEPAGRHEQARRVGRLDFSAPGPMSLPFGEREQVWAAYAEAYGELDGRDDYVPFLSYEAHPQPAGDRQVIFEALEEPPSFPCQQPMEDVDAAYGSRDDVMLEVHIGGQPPRWHEYRTDRERMVEVASGFGCAEWLLQRALRLGYRPAVCGGSDLHVGLMGGPRAVETFRGRFGYKLPMNVRDSAYGTGPLTAIVAPALKREQLWEAIKQRCTYATSGARAYLDLRCNGAPAGSEVTVADRVTISLRCHACAEIDRVDLICGEHCLRSWFPDALDFEAEATFSAEELPGEWLYARVHQVDSEYIWSSPTWLIREGDLPAAADLPLWNEDDELDLSHVGANDASPHLQDVLTYLRTEEDPALFHDVTPIEIVAGSMGRCALFFCRYGEQRLPMSIRWFFEFDIPKIRYDFGWRDFGAVDEFDVAEELKAE
ncbi:MAG: hypothetical protein PVH68_05735 [Armatimonadota bacterium]|jgi:hypothetical protein